MSKIQCIHIADIHWGAVPAARLSYELHEVFFPYVESVVDDLDFLVICGDLFHKKINMNDPTGKAVIDFMNCIMKLSLSSAKRFKVRVVKGTRTHDFDQCEVFRWMEKEPGYDFRIINHAEVEELFPDYFVLWIPEEYMENPQEFYEPFFNLEDGQKYDNVFFHGSVDFVQFASFLGENKSGRDAPCFRSADLERISHGHVLGGHIHGGQDWEGKIWYPGSFTRWHHGEEDPKRFFHHIYDMETLTSELLIVENPYAPLYVTFDIEDYLEANASMEQKKETIQALRDSCDHARIRLPAEEAADAASMAVLKEAFSADRTVRLDTSAAYKAEVEEPEDDRYAFIVNRELSVPDTIKRYIQESSGTVITKAQIEEAISPL